MSDDIHRQHAVKGNARATRLGRLIGRLMRAWGASLHVELVDLAGITRPNGHPGPVILTLWHDSIFTVTPVWAAMAGTHRKIVVLTSASKDGATLEAAMRVFGIGAVRGSSSRRAVAGLIGLRQAVRAGHDACITPDGPRGPRHHCQPGIVKLAQTTGAPIVPTRLTCGSMRRLNTWDRFIIPAPFSNVRVEFGTPIMVPRDLDEIAFEEMRRKIQSANTSGSFQSHPLPQH